MIDNPEFKFTELSEFDLLSIYLIILIFDSFKFGNVLETSCISSYFYCYIDYGFSLLHWIFHEDSFQERQVRKNTYCLQRSPM